MAGTTREKIAVILTSAGVATAVNVMSALRKAHGLDLKLIALDKNPLAVGLFLADAGLTAPQAGTPEYLEFLLDLAKKEKARFIFPLHSSEIVFFAENASVFRQAGVELLIPRPEVAGLCADKLKFSEFLASRGFNHPKTLSLPLEGPAKYPLFLKPRSSSSSKNAFKVDDELELNYLLRKVDDPILQEFSPGREYTVDCLRHQGKIYALAPRVRVSVKDGKSVVGLTVDHPAIEAEVRRLLGEIDFEGPCNVQCIEDERGGIAFIEINPRLAAGGLPLTVAAGANIPEMMLKIGLGLEVEPVEKVKPGVYMLRYLDEVFAERRDGVLSRI